MTASIRLLLCTGMLTVLGACSGKETPPAPQSSTATATDAAATGTTTTRDATPSSQTMTMAQVDRFLAAYGALSTAAKQDPALEEVASVNVSEETETQHAARIAANPKAVALLAQAGSTPQEYARMIQLLPAALFAYGMLESGAIKEAPKSIDPALLEFMKAHGKDIANKMKASGFM